MAAFTPAFLTPCAASPTLLLCYHVTATLLLYCPAPQTPGIPVRVPVFAECVRVALQNLLYYHVTTLLLPLYYFTAQTPGIPVRVPVFVECVRVALEDHGGLDAEDHVHTGAVGNVITARSFIEREREI